MKSLVLIFLSLSALCEVNAATRKFNIDDYRAWLLERDAKCIAAGIRVTEWCDRYLESERSWNTSGQPQVMGLQNAQTPEAYYNQRAKQSSDAQCEADRQLTHSILARHFKNRGGMVEAQIQDRTSYCRDGNYKVMHVILGNQQGCVASVSLRQKRVVYQDCH